ncbi:MAG: YciI family protein [Chitinophagaceae bacterium]
MQQYIMHAWDGTDEQALERRMKSRPAHFENARKLKANGNFIMGGAMLSDEGKMIGSTMVIQFETKDQLQNWLDSEPYITGKVWEKMDLRPFRVADV